ncbi:MAG: hypothetical protein A2Y73_04635 [Chloroflexi bacterium RBG_13_56_8]|nr:MAG: hypothetical protein A2Y73_04635 [Chloroflexi bacterium RBG_13_56_8]
MTQQNISFRLRRLADGLGLAVHKVWAYEVGGKYHLDAHLEMDGMLSLRDAHQQVSFWEERVRAEIPDLADVTTHIEPQGELFSQSMVDQADDETCEIIQQVIDRRGSVQGCHHIQVLQGESGRTISMHCYLPGEITLFEAHHTSDQLERELYARLEDVEQVVVHIEPKGD